MSFHGDIEVALLDLVETGIAGITKIQGPQSIPRLEGKAEARVATAHVTGATNDRLEYQQSVWEISVVVTVYWSSIVPRATRLTEWEAVMAAIRADGQLSADPNLVQMAWLGEYTFAYLADSGTNSVAAVVLVERNEV